MLKAILRFLSLWRRRNEPEGYIIEELELVVLAARRCAYDLRHAGNSVQRYGRDSKQGIETGEWYYERAHMWLKVFNPVDGGKHYRHQLHHDINRLESAVENYHQLCIKHGIDDPFYNIPF